MTTEETLPPPEWVAWQIGTPPVKEGGREAFWCAVKHGTGIAHTFLDYLNRHQMPCSDMCEPPKGAEPVENSEDEYYWTGWHQESCEHCDTQWSYSGEVIAWMRLPRLKT